MARVMLPTVAVAHIRPVSAVDVVRIVVTVAIVEIVIDRDVIVTAVPAGAPSIAAVAAPAPHRPHHHAYTEADRRRSNDSARRGIHNGRVCVYGRSPIDYRRLVAGHIDHLRI